MINMAAMEHIVTSKIIKFAITLLSSYIIIVESTRFIVSIFSKKKKDLNASTSRDMIRSYAQNKQIRRNIKRAKNLIILENERAKCSMKYVPIFEYEGADIHRRAVSYKSRGNEK